MNKHTATATVTSRKAVFQVTTTRAALNCRKACNRLLKIIALDIKPRLNTD
jgi:hypothetical protein